MTLPSRRHHVHVVGIGDSSLGGMTGPIGQKFGRFLPMRFWSGPWCAELLDPVARRTSLMRVKPATWSIAGLRHIVAGLAEHDENFALEIDHVRALRRRTIGAPDR